MDNKCQRYFNSTPNRNTFARLMVLASLDDTPLCLSEIAAEICISRQVATIMVEQCCAENWVLTVNGAYQGAPELMAKMEDYVTRHLDVMLSDLSEDYWNIVRFRQSMPSCLPLTKK